MKKVISLIMVVALIASIGTVIAAGLSENGFVYTVENGEATITDYTNNSASITIPESIGGYTVTKIGDYAFADRAGRKGADMTSLTLPSTLKVIGDGAFTVNSSITSITIPASVESIGARAFHCWINLSSVSIKGNHLSEIGNWAFRNCHQLRSITLPNSVESIGDEAFSYCTSLSSISLPKSVEEIGYEAFLGCTSLSSATILNKNMAIGDNAFDCTTASGSSRTLKISGYANSSAQRFASAENFTFVTLEEPVDPPDDPDEPEDPDAGSGDYFVRITYSVTGSNSIKARYGGFNKENNDSAGISMLYKEVNGTASDYKEVSWDLANQMTDSTGTFVLTCSVTGFPYMLYGYLDDNRAGSDAAFNISKLEVGSSDQNLKTVWSGKISLASQFNAFGVSLDWDNNAKADYFHSPDSNNKVQSSSGAWEKPYAKTISAAFEKDRLALSAESDSVSNAFSSTAIDQYGVNMDHSLCKSAALTAPAGAGQNAQVSFSAGKGNVTCSKQLHLAEQGANEQNVSLKFSWQGKDRTETGNAQFVLEDEKYTVSWVDGNGDNLNSSQVYYGDMPHCDVPEKAPDAEHHYVAAGWSPALAAVTADAQYTAQYTPQEHEFHYDERYCTPATCIQPGTAAYECAHCGFMYTEPTPTTGHDYQVINQIDPTCTQPGQKTYQCINCLDSYSEEIAATGHNYKASETVDATCTTAGSITYVCENCQDTYQTDIAALGHDYEVLEEVAPTCEQAGYTISKCSRCQDEQATVLEATGHSYESETVAPTCTAQGYTVYTCSKCDDSYQADYVDALGHDWDDGVETQAADCTHAGERLITCQRCQEEKTETIEALGHNWSDWKPITAPTCEEGGTFARSCARCHTAEEKDVDALGHDMVIKTKNPESGVEGVMYYECARGCGKFATCVINAQGKKEPGEVYEAQQEAAASSLDIPTATFNTYNCIEYHYNYVNRGAALRIDPKAAPDTQAVRFASSMLIPQGEGVEIEDFGYIYTREDYFRSLKTFVLGGDKVFSKSVKNGNYTVHNTNQGEVRTFNVVLNLKMENWDKSYVARPYVIYKFAGETFTVYDGMYAYRSVDYIADKVIKSATESQAVKDYVQNKIINR
ncbi:MAG: leucine-rich repeat domain-containing protein [Clostridia bacterium]|nr:leucine-rich repeat domain-containing protein [Clostridia bacterium]